MLVREVEVRRAAESTDAHNNTSRSWSTPTVWFVRGWLAQISSSEDGQYRPGHVTGWLLTVPGDADVRAEDRVIIDEVTYEVDGPPNTSWTPRGAHHQECRLLLVEG